jgi:hypothetical protein
VEHFSASPGIRAGHRRWIFVELAIIRQYSWLQTAYFGLGALELILVLALLGVIPALVDPLREADRKTTAASGS